MKRVLAAVLTCLVLMGSSFAETSKTMSDQLIALEKELSEKGEIGWEFNRWKIWYNEAMTYGKEYLFGSKKFQAVTYMTIGKRGTWEQHYQTMKQNKFLQALSGGDAYDFGLDAVVYLSKAYKKSQGIIRNDRGHVLGMFVSDKEGTSWSFYGNAGLAEELGVTKELIDAWEEALSAYSQKLVYLYSGNP